MPKKKSPKRIETITHADDRRPNIPTAEHQSVMSEDDKAPVALRNPRNPDLDPQLVWRGKDAQDDADRTEFYRHEQSQTNCMILGDSLKVMASLADREAEEGLTATQLDRILEMHLIHPDHQRNDDFESFFVDRKEALSARGWTGE